jgi:putative PIN family toxin of toxin-antitoxin system
MIVVIDTNVLLQALKSKNGASHYILRLIREQKVTIALSLQVFKEYEDVLKRPEILKIIGLSFSDIEKVLRFISYIAKPFTTYYLFRPNLKDEKDNIFVELSLVSNAQYVITNNIKDFTQNSDLKFDDLKIITPADFVKYWRNNYEN